MRLLPVGTVVKLDIKADQKVMIIARLVKTDEAADTMWDYCGCIVPDGFTQTDALHFFNHSDIQQLLFIGFQDEQELKYSVALVKYRGMMEKEAKSDGEPTD